MAFYVYSSPSAGVVRIHRTTCSMAARAQGDRRPNERHEAPTIEAAIFLARTLKEGQGGGRIEGCGLCGTDELI